MEAVRVNLAERSYSVLLGVGVLRQLGSVYRDHNLGPRAALVTDDTVAALYAHCARESLSAQGIDASVIQLPAGEAQKTLSSADYLYERLIASGCDRTSTVIALGGGVIGDLAGFVAATFLRGVAFVQVPTTLIAQVDSSIGGKTGINHRLGKNLIGAFHQPRFVLIDPSLLQSLPRGEVWSGLSEVVKYGLIANAQLFADVTCDLATLARCESADRWSRIIAHCCKIKAEITATDERESDRRRILNFGHTIGHALEAVSHFGLRHGEAIAWGMRAAAWVSHQRAMLSDREHERIAHVLDLLPKPAVTRYDVAAILDHVHRDKKVRAGELHFVLLKGIGDAVVCADVDGHELRAALRYIGVGS